jgi:hypothetical protein
MQNNPASESTMRALRCSTLSHIEWALVVTMDGRRALELLAGGGGGSCSASIYFGLASARRATRFRFARFFGCSTSPMRLSLFQTACGRRGCCLGLMTMSSGGRYRTGSACSFWL